MDRQSNASVVWLDAFDNTAVNKRNSTFVRFAKEIFSVCHCAALKKTAAWKLIGRLCKPSCSRVHNRLPAGVNK